MTQLAPLGLAFVSQLNEVNESKQYHQVKRIYLQNGVPLHLPVEVVAP